MEGTKEGMKGAGTGRGRYVKDAEEKKGNDGKRGEEKAGLEVRKKGIRGREGR